jgi:glycyl-tRNA synthetase
VSAARNAVFHFLLLQVDASWVVDPALFAQDEEHALHAAYESVRASVSPGMPLSAFLAAVAPLLGPIDAFFDAVFVMADAQDLRRNRLALLRDVAALPRGVIDLAELPGF